MEEIKIELVEFATPSVKSVLEYRAYYTDDGSIITYTSEKLDGKYIVITKEQYAEARHDAVVVDNQLRYTHKKTHLYKLVRKNNGKIATSKYDINILTHEECIYWNYESHEIIK